MRVAVTGAGGYIGSSLCQQLLAKGHSVLAMDNFHRGNCDALVSCSYSDKFEFMFGDVTNPNDVDKLYEDIDAIVHLAAIVGFPKCDANPALSSLVNVEGTRIICERKDKDIPLLFASTGSVYGKVEGLCTEYTPLNSVSHYGKTKIEGEKIIQDTHNARLYRFATGFGVSPNMRVDLLVNDLVYQGIKNGTLTIFQADFYRTFIHVRDISASFVFGLENFDKMKYRVYNVGSDQNNMTKRELAEYIKQRVGCSVFYNEFSTDKDQRNYKVDYSRIYNEGWRPTLTMSQGIDELLRVNSLIRPKHQYE